MPDDRTDSTLRAARERRRFARERLDHAARAVLEGSPDAARLANEALAEFTRADTALRRLTAPRPVGPWLAWARHDDRSNA